VNEGHHLIIYTAHRPLIALKEEFGDRCEYIESVMYPSPYGKNGAFAVKLSFIMPSIINAMLKEHKQILEISEEKKIDLFISDSKYGAFDKKKPSIFIFHQLRYIPPTFLKFLRNKTEKFNYFFRDSFKKFVVPDFRTNGGLTGDLAHNLSYFPEDKIEYIGILSDYEKMNVDEDIDYLISLSGREPNRTMLENRIVSQLHELNGKVVLVRGTPEEVEKLSIPGVEIVNYAGKGVRDELMNRAKFVIARSGYSTIMDIVELGKKGLLIPTPGQTEQEYLSEYLSKKKYFYSVNEDELMLRRDVEKAQEYTGFNPPWRTKESVEKFMKIVKELI
jgi:uncharacterized protein (TIGR00661 family)